MKKYYTITNYSNLKGVDYTTVRDWIKKHKIKQLVIKESLQNLVVEDDQDGACVISLMNLKGGCAKTTTAVHLAVLLAKLDYRVLLIDTDHQNQCELFFPDHEYEFTILNIFEGAPISDCVTTIQEKDYSIDLLYSDYALTMAMTSMRFQNQDHLSKALYEVKDKYDYVIIDTSPTFDIISVNVAKASNYIIIPMTPLPLHVRGMIHNFSALEDVAKISIDKVIGILPTIVEPKLAQPKAYLDALQEEYGNLLFSSYIPKDTQMPKVVDYRTNIFDYREKSKASQSIKKFTWELLQRL